MSSPALPMPALGTRIGNYRLVGHLGHGAMGAVFEAFHEGVGGRAAIKILRIDVAARLDLTTRFFDEARAANAIEHPSIIRIFDSGQTPEGFAYLAMEFLSGETLGQRLKRLGRLPIADAIRLTRQVASALTAVHARGVIHRDLKPENLMIVADPEAPGGERIKVLDFGIARLAADLRPAGSDTASGVILGTPVYMSPEQCHGAKQVSAPSDVYSLGIILYKMLAGDAPFVSAGLGALFSMHLTEQPAPIQQRNPEVPDDLAALLHAMLEKSPTARPTMRQVDADLRGRSSVVEAQPKAAPVSRHEAVTRKLAPVDLRAMLAPAALSPVKPEAKQSTAPISQTKQADPARPPSAPPPQQSGETTTLSRTTRRRLLWVTLAVALLGGTGGAGIVARSLIRQPLQAAGHAAIADAAVADVSSPSVAIPDSISANVGFDASFVEDRPGTLATVKSPASPRAAGPTLRATVPIPPFRPADTVVPSSEKGVPFPESALKPFPGSTSRSPPDGGTKRAPERPPADAEGLRNPFQSKGFP